MAARESIIRRAGESGVPLLLIRLFLGLYFIRAGVVKAMDPIDFLKAIRLYGLLPETPAFFLNATAITLPWLEIICGVALVLGVWLRGAALQIAGMLVVFMPAILLRALAMMRADAGLSFFDVSFDCGCGTGVEIIWIKLLKNAGLSLLALFVLFSRSRRFRPTNLLARGNWPAAIERCLQCGRPIQDSTDGLCESCRSASPVSISTSGAAT